MSGRNVGQVDLGGQVDGRGGLVPESDPHCVGVPVGLTVDSVAENVVSGVVIPLDSLEQFSRGVVDHQ